MNCFYHRESPAVGTCRSCARGLCAECAAEYPQGLACRGRCETDVEEVIDLIRRNLAASRVIAKQAPGNRVAFLVIGAFIVLFGLLFIWASLLKMPPVWILLALGILVAGYGVFMLVRVYRLRPIE